jgi:hypothetical protein
VSRPVRARPDRHPVEAKVKTSTGTALVAAFIADWVLHRWPWLADESHALQAVIIAVVSAVATFLAGYATHHTHRPAAPPPPTSPLSSKY